VTRPTVLAHDVPVQTYSPLGAAIGSALTGGIYGAVHHHRTNEQLRLFGRARGRMPFAFVHVSPGPSTVVWIAGVVAWYVVVAVIVSYVSELLDGSREPGAGDITTFASLALLLAPLLLVTVATLRRVRRAQHLAGVDAPWPRPLRGALVAVAFPPLGTWLVQRELNRVWRAYR
jgi:hypothetical protein